MPLQITSSARIKPTHQVIAVHGGHNIGKTMLLPTAENTLWAVSEKTRIESLSQANIEKVYGPKMTDAELAAEFQKDNPAWKKNEIAEAVMEASNNLASYNRFKARPGITYDVPHIKLFDYKAVTEAVDFIKSPDAAKFKTVFMDSASAVCLMIQEWELGKKTAKGNQVDGRMASKKFQDFTYQWFCDLITIPKNWIFVFHSEERFTEIGTGEDKILQKDLYPALYGNKLRSKFTYLFSNIFQVVHGGKDDNGNGVRLLRTRATTEYGAERTSCPQLNDLEPANIAALFEKMRGN